MGGWGNIIRVSPLTAVVLGQEWAAQFNRERDKPESHVHMLAQVTGDTMV